VVDQFDTTPFLDLRFVYGMKNVACGTKLTCTEGATGTTTVALDPTTLPTHQYGGSFGTPGGTALTTGLKTYFPVTDACTIKGYNVMAERGNVYGQVLEARDRNGDTDRCQRHQHFRIVARFGNCSDQFHYERFHDARGGGK
jgi:hypothetical protein